MARQRGAQRNLVEWGLPLPPHTHTTATTKNSHHRSQLHSVSPLLLKRCHPCCSSFTLCPPAAHTVTPCYRSRRSRRCGSRTLASGSGTSRVPVPTTRTRSTASSPSLLLSTPCVSLPPLRPPPSPVVFPNCIQVVAVTCALLTCAVLSCPQTRTWLAAAARRRARSRSLRLRS